MALEPIDRDVSFAAEVEELPVESQILGPYVLIKEIGRGGMGIIYRAVHQETNQLVALKTVLPQNATCAETLARFERETKAVQDLVHTNLMPIHEVGRSIDGIPFIAMEMAVGGSLDMLLEKYQGHWRQIAALLIKIASAVHHAHERGILHRDLKPGNILFTEDHEPLVTDFGLAKQLIASDDLTQSCAILGTPNYVAPEQAAGKTRDLTAAADIYSLGAIFYELLAGRPPFVGENPLDVLRQVASQSPTELCKLVPAVPRVLASICMRCLERQPEDRYASALDFGKDLQSWLRGDAIAPRPQRLRFRWLTKRTGRIGVLCGVVVVLIVAIWIGWTVAKHSGLLRSNAAPIAVFIDDLDQDSDLRAIARQATAHLEEDLANTLELQPVGPGIHPPAWSDGVRDPLVYGRSTNARVVLTGCVRRSGSKTRLVTRLLRCDTGEIIWRDTENIPENHLGVCLPPVCAVLVKALVGQWRSGVNNFAQTIHHVPLPEAKTYYTRAMELAARSTRHDFEDAEKLFQQAVEIDPKFASARAMLAFMRWTQAEAYEEWDKLPLAMSAAHDALLIDPHSIQARRVIASCLLQDGRKQEALDQFWSTVEDDPQSAGSCSALGICLRTMGQPDQAIPWMRRAVQLEPARGSTHAILGETLLLCGHDDEGQEELVRASRLDGDQSDMSFDLSAMRLWQTRFDEARHICAQTREHFPDSRFGLTMAAWIEFCAGEDLETAAVDFEKLRLAGSYQHNWKFYGAVNPNSALAYLAKQKGLDEQARSFVAESVRVDQDLLHLHPQNPRILHDLAATFSVAGDTEQALLYLRKAIAAGWVEQRSTRIDPRFSDIAKSPQFRALVEMSPQIAQQK